MILKYCDGALMDDNESLDVIIDLAAGDIYGELEKYGIYEGYVDDKFKNMDVTEYSYKDWGDKIVSYREGIVETDIPEELLRYLYHNNLSLKETSDMLDLIKDFNDEYMKAFVDLVDNGIRWDTAARICESYGGEPVIIEDCPDRAALGKYIWESYDGEFFYNEGNPEKIITKEVIDALFEVCAANFYDLYGERCETCFEHLYSDRYVLLD